MFLFSPSGFVFSSYPPAARTYYPSVEPVETSDPEELFEFDSPQKSNWATMTYCNLKTASWVIHILCFALQHDESTENRDTKRAN